MTRLPGFLVMLAMATGQAPTFKTGVDLVSVSVVVKNQKGRPVSGLSRTDFELFDAGRMRDIADLHSEASPVSVAVLLDASGSMRIGGKWAAARDAMARIAAQLQAGRDRIALFTFDSELRVVQPFTTSPSDAVRALNAVEPWGSTAMFDAVSEAGRRLAEEGGPRRAIVVITDGLDNRSRLDAAGVAAAVSAVDVPVYSIVVSAARDERLSELSRGTGGVSFVSSAPMDTTAAAGQIVTELRSQYVMTFESGTPAGWHPLLVRVHENTELVVRTRSGYIAGPRS